MSDTSFTPIENPDLSTIDPTTIGVDPTITTESINANTQPFSLDYNTGTLNISKPVVLENATIGNVDLISPLPNPNLSNQLVVPSLQVGGTMMANDIILGSNGTTKLISDSSGTYIYGDVNVSGIIYNSGLSDKFSTLSNTVNSKANADNVYTKTESDSKYQLRSNMVNYVTTTSLSAYQTIANMTNYITSTSLTTTLSNYLTTATASSTYQTIANMTNYITSTSLSTTLSNYLTTAAASSTYQTISNMTNYVTSTSLTSTLSNYLTTATASTTYQTIANMTNYITSTSLTTTLNNYQTIANMSNYITSTSLTTTLNSYLTTATASSTYQTIANMTNYITSTSLTSTLSTYATLASPTFTGTPTIGTNQIAVKPWVSGRFGGVSSGNPNITGTASNSGTGSGTQTFTVTRASAGTYNVNWTTAHPSGSTYTILVSVRGAFTCSYGVPGSTSFQIYTYTVGTNTLADPTSGDISFSVLQ